MDIEEKEITAGMEEELFHLGKINSISFLILLFNCNAVT